MVRCGRSGRPGHLVALVQRVAGVRGQLGLHADDWRASGHSALDRGGHAGDQPAAAAPGRRPGPPRGSRRRSPARRCPGRRSPGGRRTAGSTPPRAGRPSPGGRQPGGQAGRRDHDLRTQLADGGHLDRGGVIRHHHDRGHPEQRGGVGHGLAVIAAGVGDHARSPGGRGQRTHRRVGAAQLERPRRLQRFGLDQQGPGSARGTAPAGCGPPRPPEPPRRPGSRRSTRAAAPLPYGCRDRPRPGHPDLARISRRDQHLRRTTCPRPPRAP